MNCLVLGNNAGGWGSNGSLGSISVSNDTGWGSSGVSNLLDGWGSDGLGSISDSWGSSGITDLFNGGDGWGSGGITDLLDGDGWLSDGLDDWLVNLVGVGVGVDVVGLDDVLDWSVDDWSWDGDGSWDIDWDWDLNVFVDDDFSFNWNWDSTWDWDVVFLDVQLWNDVGGGWGKGDMGSAWGKNLFLDNGISGGWSVVVQLLWENWDSGSWDSWGWEWDSLGCHLSWFDDVGAGWSWDSFSFGVSVLVTHLDSLGSDLDASGSDDAVLDFGVRDGLSEVNLFGDVGLGLDVSAYLSVTDMGFTNLSVSNDSGVWGSKGQTSVSSWGAIGGRSHKGEDSQETVHIV